MEINKFHLRHVLLWEFRKKTTAAKCHKMITEIYGDIINVSTCRRWFRKFKSGDFNLEDNERSGQKMKIDVKLLYELVEENPRLNTTELATILKVNPETVRLHLHKIGKDLKCGLWIPKELNEYQLNQRSSIAKSNLLRNKKENFLHRIITCDEKWVLYDNVKNRKQWLSKGQTPLQMAKPGINRSKVMLCIWWGSLGVIHWELLQSNQTVTSDVYCTQLDRVQQELLKSHASLVNRKGVILLQDNARAHVSTQTKNKISELGWEILPHAPYSPDMSPTDYHIFRSLQHHICTKKYQNLNDVKNDITLFLNQKKKEFFKKGIESLPERWAQVVENNGKYIIDSKLLKQ
jgi:[histone H3]-lysine36 N-dimethyltransferase SETMAR